MKDGDTDKLADGTTVGVTDVLYQDYAGGIHSATFFLGANKLELKDTDVTDAGSTTALKVDDNTIDDALVTIEGSDTNSTFKITRIHVNMTADDNYFVPAGGKLSDAIKQEGGTSAEPEVLFTQNWNIEYRGLKNVNSEKIKLKTSGSNQYNLKFIDGDGNNVDVPIAKALAANQTLFGEIGKDFINVENRVITKDDYFVVTDGSRKRGERKTYVLQYKGADKVTADNPVLKFKNVGSGNTIEQTYSQGSPLATLKIGGADFRVYSESDIFQNDFDIKVDLDADGAINNINDSFVNITTRYGAEIGLINLSLGQNIPPNIILSIKTPDENRDGNAKDNTENLIAIDFVVNITSDSNAKVSHTKLSGFTSGQKGQQLSLRTPDGKTNVEYGYTSYGAFITRETPTNDPTTFEVDYPESQRYSLVYITTGNSNVIEEPGSNITISNSKRKWKVETSNHLELGEEFRNGNKQVETLRNITTYIDKSNLDILASGSVTNNKSTYPYNQYMYFLGPGTESALDAGYVIYTENDNDIVADFLHYKSGKEIGRWLLEFTTAFESGIYDDSGNPSLTGLSLKDFEGSILKILGKNYTISTAKRTSTDGNGVELTLINGADKLELNDTDIKDVASTDTLKVNDNNIDDAFVIIEGSDDNSTFKITRLHVNMTADDNFFIPAGGRLGDIITEEGGSGAEPGVLFTQNWDIAYLGLNNPDTQKIKLSNSDSNQYNLKFVDGNGNLVTVPIAKSSGGNEISMGGANGLSNGQFINSESLSIPKDAYFIITDASRKRGERPTLVLQYKGADKITADNPLLKFKELGSGNTIEQIYTNSSPLATLNIEGANYDVYAIDDPMRAVLSSDDFSIRVDMDSNNILNNDSKSNIVITSLFGAEINITNQTNRSILLRIRTPDENIDGFAKNSIENLYPSVLMFNITAESGMINHVKYGNLNFRTPDGQPNVEQTYTSYGTFVKREFPDGQPATLDIDYPSAQREPLVYYESGSSQSKLLENLPQGNHSISIICSDIFDNIFDDYIAFTVNFTDKDNDGIPDAEDTLLGNSSSINTSTINPIIEVDSSTNLSKELSETKLVKIKNNNQTIAEFEFNFSNGTLDLSNINIDIQINSTNGMTIISLKGLSIIGTKTVYVGNVNNLTTLCIKDAEVTSITQISSLCNGANEFGINCPGTANNNQYNCTFADETNSTFKITGLIHSGIQQQSYCGDGIVNSGEDCSNCPSDAGSCPSGGGGGSSGGGSSGGGGGGGGGLAFVCNMDWQCGEWSECINSVQARQCEFAKVPQHVSGTECPSQEKSPAASQSCEVKAQELVTGQAISTPESKSTTETAAQQISSEEQEFTSGLSAISGAVTKVFSNPKAVKELAIGGLILAIAGVLGYHFLYKRK